MSQDNILCSLNFGESVRVRSPHLCSPHCGDPCAIYREVKEMESKIAEMKQILDSTIHSYRELRAKMNIFHDPFVSRVPLEIATTIFRFCLPMGDKPIYSPFILDRDTKEDFNARVLFTLGGVCKTWRQLIWSTPYFWSHLSTCIKPTTLLTSIEITNDWLDRSAQVPLSIQVYLASTTEYELDDFFEELYATQVFPELTPELINGVSSLSKVINASCPRWESLDLRLPPSLFSMFHGEPPNLRELRIDNYDRGGDPPACLLSAEGGERPTPTYVAFDFVRFKALDISWNNVTCIDTKGIDLQECVELLREAPQLMQCNFGMIKPPRNPWSGPRHVVHQGLKDLKILIPFLGGMYDCLTHLTLPSLQCLSISLYGLPLPAQNILSLIERSSCTLVSLDVGAVLVEETLVDMLKQIPSLYYLSLKPCITDKTFSAEGFFKLLARTAEYPDEEVDDDDEENENASENVSENANECPNPSSTQNTPDGVLTHQEPSSPSPPNQEIFLPDLECFRYDQFRPEECTKIWDLIPAAFGYEARKETDYLRPMRWMTVILEPPMFMMDGEIPAPQFINKTTLGRMKELTDEGCEIQVLVSLKPRLDGEDFIARSLEWNDEQENRDRT